MITFDLELAGVETLNGVKGLSLLQVYFRAL